jgi:hypothetical protein
VVLALGLIEASDLPQTLAIAAIIRDGLEDLAQPTSS